jgi:hypothetical protein
VTGPDKPEHTALADSPRSTRAVEHSSRAGASGATRTGITTRVDGVGFGVGRALAAVLIVGDGTASAGDGKEEERAGSSIRQ